MEACLGGGGLSRCNFGVNLHVGNEQTDFSSFSYQGEGDIFCCRRIFVFFFSLVGGGAVFFLHSFMLHKDGPQGGRERHSL